MNWDFLRDSLDRTVREEAVKVLDEAIARLQALRSEYVGGTTTKAGPPPSHRGALQTGVTRDS